MGTLAWNYRGSAQDCPDYDLDAEREFEAQQEEEAEREAERLLREEMQAEAWMARNE